MTKFKVGQKVRVKTKDSLEMMGYPHHIPYDSDLDIIVSQMRRHFGSEIKITEVVNVSPTRTRYRMSNMGNSRTTPWYWPECSLENIER